MPSRQKLIYDKTSQIKTPQVQVKKEKPISEGERFLKRIVDSATFGISGELEKAAGGSASFRQARAGAGGNIADFISTGVGFLVPGIGWVKGAQALAKVPKFAKVAGALTAKRAVPKIAEGATKATTKAKLAAIGKTAASRAVEGAAFGAAYTVPQLAGRTLNPEDYTMQQNLRTAGENIIGGAVLDPLIGGGFDVIGAGAKKILTPKVQLERAEQAPLEQMELAPEYQAPPSVVSTPVAAQVVTQPVAQPVVQPVARPITQPVVQPMAIPTPKPEATAKTAKIVDVEREKIIKENEVAQKELLKKQEELSKYEEKLKSLEAKDEAPVNYDKEIKALEEESTKINSIYNAKVQIKNQETSIKMLKDKYNEPKPDFKGDKEKESDYRIGKKDDEREILRLENQKKTLEDKLSSLKETYGLTNIDDSLDSLQKIKADNNKQISKLKSEVSSSKAKIVENKTKAQEERKASEYAVNKTKKEIEELNKRIKEVPEAKTEAAEPKEAAVKGLSKENLDLKIRENQALEDSIDSQILVLERIGENDKGYKAAQKKIEQLNRKLYNLYKENASLENAKKASQEPPKTIRDEDLPFFISDIDEKKILEYNKQREEFIARSGTGEVTELPEIKKANLVEEVKVEKAVKDRYKESKKIAKDLAKKQDEAIKTGDIEAKKEIDEKVIEFEKTILPIMNNALKEIIDAYKANPNEVNKKAILSEYENLIEQIDFLNKNQHLFTGKSQYNKEILIGYRKKLINSLSDDDIAQYLKINTPKITFDENGVPKIETQPLNKDVADFIVSIALDRYTGWEKLDFKGVASDKFLLSFSTIDRVLEKLFNESGLISDSKNLFKKVVLDGFTQGKKDWFDYAKHYTDQLNEWAKKGFKIGSDESAFTQMYGEEKITYEGLVSIFGEAKAKEIVEFDAWNQKVLREMVDAQNVVLKAMDEPEIKLVRGKYYRHLYDENAQTAEQLINRKLSMSSGAGNPLGVKLKDIFRDKERAASAESLDSLPNPDSRFNPTRQQRTTDKTVYDATRGTLDYIIHSGYQIHASPYIKFFKSLNEQLALKKNPKLAPFQKAIQSFTSNLQGVNDASDLLLDKYFNKRILDFTGWLNNRIKSNNVVGSATAGLAQLTNLAPAAAILGFKNLAKGISTTLKYSLLHKKGLDIYDPSLQSAFLKERFDMLDLYRRFETSLFQKATNATAKVTLEYADAFVTKSIWHTAYEQALKEGVPNPVLRADDITRKTVAGRGVGEKSAAFSDRIIEAFLPFQIDVANIVSLSTDVAKRNPVAFGNLMMANFLVNGLTYTTIGRNYLFDPLKAVQDGLDSAEKELEDKDKYTAIGGRLAGEFLKSVPGGQVFGSFGTPEWRKKFYGESDPTKYGSGLLVQSIWENPVEMVAYQVALPFGGVQARRMVQAVMSVTDGGVSTTAADPFTIGDYIFKKVQKKPYDKELKFLLDNGNFFEMIKPFVGGVWSTEAGQEYIKNNRRALSEKQTQIVRGSKNPAETYANIMYIRERDKLVRLIKDIQKNKEYSEAQKKEYTADVRERLRILESTR